MIMIKRVGELISYVDERNTDGAIRDFYGININKEFMPTVASTEGIDARKYKVVRDNRFVFSGMQTGRDKCIRIGLYKGSPIIISPAYTTFEIKNTEMFEKNIPVFQINLPSVSNQSSQCFNEYLQEAEKKGEALFPYLFYPFDFTSMQPVDGTRHRLLR